MTERPSGEVSDSFLDEGLLVAASRNDCIVSVFTSRDGMASDHPMAAVLSEISDDWETEPSYLNMKAG